MSSEKFEALIKALVDGLGGNPAYVFLSKDAYGNVIIHSGLKEDTEGWLRPILGEP